LNPRFPAVFDRFNGQIRRKAAVKNAVSLGDGNCPPPGFFAETLMKTQVLSVLVENRAGTLSRVAGLFSRRGFNIDSLTVGETEDADISRMTIAVHGDDAVLEQIVKQLGKLVDVISIRKLNNEDCIKREILLVKVKSDEKNRSAIVEVAAIFRSRVIDISTSTITIEATGSFDKLNGMLCLLRPYGILELARTGLVALERGPKVLSADE
jgi:acetolactate synthase-1/3 small subunit